MARPRQLKRRPAPKKRTNGLRCVVVVVVVTWMGLLALYAQPLALSVDPVPIEEAAAIEKENSRKESEAALESDHVVAEAPRKEAPRLPLPEDEAEEEHHGVFPSSVEGGGVFPFGGGGPQNKDKAPDPPLAVAPLSSESEEESESLVMERDDRTGLYVPEFWRGGNNNSPTEELADGEQPTIFLMIASYRDFQCRDSITSALDRAAFPERVRVAAVQQNREGDVTCAEPEVPCAEKPDQALCKYKSHIKVYEMDADDASGPVYARHVGYRMYRGETYAMQIDAHCVFVNRWDDDIIRQFQATKNDMAVLSTYLTDVQGSVAPNGDSKRRTRPIMCNSDFEGRPPARYLRHNSQPEAVPVIQEEPMLQPFWAAGFSFARGHFVVNVKYDCCLPMVFMGEEISIGIRAWTHGYDLYAPQRSVVFHEYAQNSKRRAAVPKFWERRQHKEKGQQGGGNAAASLKRLTALIGMAPDLKPETDYDAFQAEQYGLGTKRKVADFYDLFLVDVHAKKAQPLCKFVEGGALHREVHRKHLRPDGQGIDYSQVTFDTQAFLDANLYVPVANRLQRAIERRDHNALAQVVNEATRVKLERRSDHYADLLKQARHLQASLMQHAP